MKYNWKVITGIFIVLILSSICIYQYNKIKTIKRELNYCEEEKYDLENQLEVANYRIQELENELKTCQEKLNNVFYKYNSNSYNVFEEDDFEENESEY